VVAGPRAIAVDGAGALRRFAGLQRQVRRPPRLFGALDRGGADADRGRFGGAGDRRRLVDPRLQLGERRRQRPRGKPPLVGVVALAALDARNLRTPEAEAAAESLPCPSLNRFRGAAQGGRTRLRDQGSTLKNPRDFFQPLAMGAPEPLREIPVRPSRMIHFLDFSNEKMVAKAADIATKTDILLGNLEDAIPADRKEAARQGLIKAAKESDFGQTALWTRINSLESPWVLDDLTTLVAEIGDRLDVVMVPKVEGAWDIHYVDRLLAQLEAKAGLDRPILIHAILETALGVTNLEEIAAASPRMQGMSFGPADLAASRRMKTTRVGGGHPGYRVMEDPADPENPEADRVSAQQDLWHYSIGRMVDACAATGILPFYGPFGDIKDTAGCETQFRAAFLMGCVGAWSLHPVQIGIAKKVFSPPPEEVKFALKVLEAIPDGRGVHMIDGKMQDDATWKQCKVMVELAEMLAAKDPELAEAYGLRPRL
jgi:malyl-CoA/(S)-citramalyl-CoA lyase